MNVNRLLRALPQADRALLEPSLERVELLRGTALEEIGIRTEFAFFIETGLAAMVARSPVGQIGIGVVGDDGMTGLETVHHVSVATHEVVVQAAGMALRIPSAALREAMAKSVTLQALLQRYAHVLMVQASQSALCNARANVEQRLARWVLMSHDRLRGDDLRITHEFISLMLGVRRASVTSAIHVLEGQYLLKSTREKLQVLDRQGLIDMSSGSYGVCENVYERLIDPTYRRSV